MSKKQSEQITVVDKTNRRRFLRTSGTALLAGATVAMSGSTLAADCDNGGEQAATDQDAGESADPKGCQQENIISSNQPKRTGRVVVKTLKG